MALKEVGRIERTLFILKYLQDVQLRRRIHAGLNKGEARNALARAVFFNRMGEIRDRNFESQNYRASGLNLVTAAIILWNTVYIDRVVKSMKASGRSVNKDLLQNLSPISWDHINLTGDYIWPSKYLLKGKFRDLKPFSAL
jgi:TnpA family transposase